MMPVTVIANACGDENVLNLMMRTERFAIAVADGFSRVSNGKRFGVAAVQGGVNACGIQMAYGAVAQAFEDNTPLLVITEGVAPDVTETSHYDVKAGFSPVTKWVGYINKSDRVPEYVRRAITYLKTGRPGPVLLHIPRRLGRYDLDEYPYIPVKGWKYPGNPRDVKIAVRAILTAKKPLLYAGQGIFYADACEELREFAELVQTPVLTTLKGKSTFPENHPLSIGVRGGPAEHFLLSSDLIFGIGTSLNKGRFSHSIPRSGDKVIVQCTIDELDINKNYNINHAIIGDAKLVLQQLIEEVKKQAGSEGVGEREETRKEIMKQRETHMEKYLPLLGSEDKPINPYRVYRDLMDTIDRNNSFVTHDSGNTRDQLSTIYEAIIPHGFMGWGNVSTLGFGLGAAIGAKLAFPKRQVVNVTGDAGVAYQLGNYEAIIRNKIGITTVMINNSGYAGYGPGFWGSGHDPYTYALTSSSVQNLAKSVEALGEHAERIEEPDEIVPALKRAFKENKSGRPAFIEIICKMYPVYGRWLGPGH
jgi:acetolactate synthase-1/2/3 large subunit